MKRIAISQRLIHVEKGTPRDALEQDYSEYYSTFDVALIPIPNVIRNIETYLDALQVNGIILSGGNDINPELYGESPEDKQYADDRDKTESALLDYAIKKKLPVLCECRGAQLANVYFGGKLKKILNHVATNHSVEIIDDFFDMRNVTVNSFHNWGFTREELGKDLKPFAMADEVVEGFYHEKYPIVGILWHPERASPDPKLNKRITTAFLERRWRWTL
jgi:putative glutamine amidotransferase